MPKHLGAGRTFFLETTLKYKIFLDTYNNLEIIVDALFQTKLRKALEYRNEK